MLLLFNPSRDFILSFLPSLPFSIGWHLLFYLYWCCSACVLSCIWLFVTPGTVAHQAPLPMRFSWQEYWSGLLFFSPGDHLNLGNQTCVSCIAGRFFTSEPSGKSENYLPMTTQKVCWKKHSCSRLTSSRFIRPSFYYLENSFSSSKVLTKHPENLPLKMYN